MGRAEFIGKIKDRGITFLTDEPMKKHTTFKIGGGAETFISVKNEDELLFAVREARQREIPVFIVGKGSNLLVSDGGIDGAVICLDKMKGVRITGDTVTAAAGESLQALCLRLQKAGLSGLEFAYGIPGTVGGAVFMNAGAYGGEMADRIVSARYLDTFGEIREIDNAGMKLGYRNSIFRQNEGIILSVKLKLSADSPENIRRKMDDFLSRRKEKQPLEFPSAGSVFKRPEGNFAGTLIEKSGLKGKSVGGAAVSRKHAGFIVNTGGATSRDVTELIEIIQNKVFKDSGVMLQTEVIYIGR